MAEVYQIGTQRIFYRSRQFKTGKVVTMDILDPDLIWIYDVMFTEVGSGLYFYDFNFLAHGTYVAVVYEDGEKVVSQNFLVTTNTFPSFFEVDTIPSKGPSVINT
jgi:hypothetical protein